MSKLSLADRFDAMTQKKNQVAQEQNLQEKSMEELGNMTVLFGQAKLGLKFSEVKEDASYCKWFLRKWGDSEKAEHRALIRYLQLWIERQELEHGVPDTSTGSAGEKADFAALPKAKAKPISSGGKSSQSQGPIDLENDLDEEEWWDHLTPTEDYRENKNAKRLDQLEGVLSEVVTQLKVVTAQMTTPQ